MSNHKGSENLPHRKSEVSRATVIVPGLVGPKPRRVSVGDGQRVNIPVPVMYCPRMRGMVSEADSWLYPSKRLVFGQSANETARKSGISVSQADKKSPQAYVHSRPYRKPTQVLTGRVDQGVRVILRQGTRQKSGRNFGIRPAWALHK